MYIMFFMVMELKSFLYSRNHGKGHLKPGDVPPPSLLGTLMGSLCGSLSPQPIQTSTCNTSVTVPIPSFNLKDTSPNGYLNRSGGSR